jgi:hypothetical protein
MQMKKIFLTLALAASLASASAQLGTPQTGVSAAMLKMFGDTKAFTAKAEARILDKDQKEVSSLPMIMALRDGKLRAEMDLSEVKNGSIPPEASAMMKQAGMDKMVTVVRSDKKATVISYPGLKSYAEVPFSETEAGDEKVEFTDMGKETIDGHACTKKKITSTDSKGRPQEAFVWQASDLKNFPVQMQMAQRRNTLIVKFQPPKLEAPDAALFDTPASYTKYNSVQELMQAAMMKMFSGAGAGAK